MDVVRAVVLHEGVVGVADVELPGPGPGQARVEVRAATTCGLDRHAVWAHVAARPAGGPLVLGHEAVGRVTAVGDGVERVEVDDLVLVTSQRWCGTCATCIRGDRTLCLAARADASTRVHARLDGAPVQAAMATGALAEATVVDATALHRLPEDIPDAHALLFACALPTGLGAVRNVARAWPGEQVVVVGGGAVGLAAVQGARLAGATPLALADPHDSRRALATELGVAHAVTPDELAATVDELTDGVGVEHVVVAAPGEAALQLAADCVRTGGTVVLVGTGRGPSAWHASAWEGTRLVGTVRGSGHLDDDVPQLLELGMDRRLVLDPLVGPEAGLDDVAALLDDPGAVRPLVRP